MSDISPDLKYWVAFSRISRVGAVRMQLLKSYFDSMAEAWTAGPSELRQAGLDSGTIASIVELRPTISPDGRHVAFVRTPVGDDDAVAQAWVLPLDGGEPWQLTADFEHRSATLPVSLWLSATRMRGAGNTNAWIALAGFRIFMDRPGSTLQSHEQDVPFAFQLPQLVSGGIL